MIEVFWASNSASLEHKIWVIKVNIQFKAFKSKGKDKKQIL